MLHRLSKAAQWSSALSDLCASRADKRTALEADAYMGYMHGNFELECEEWEAAAAHREAAVEAPRGPPAARRLR